MESLVHLAVILIIVVALLGCGFFVTKIVTWYNKYRYEKYSNNSAEFIADLYRLKMKWVKRGEFMYARALNMVIGAETEQYEQDASYPETDAGKSYLDGMKRVIDEEAKKRAAEIE